MKPAPPVVARSLSTLLEAPLEGTTRFEQRRLRKTLHGQLAPKGAGGSQGGPADLTAKCPLPAGRGAALTALIRMANASCPKGRSRRVRYKPKRQIWNASFKTEATPL